MTARPWSSIVGHHCLWKV